MCGEKTLGVSADGPNGFLRSEKGMEFIDCADGTREPRIMPQIGSNYQASMPPLKQSARIASLEYLNRDQWYAWGLPLPVTYIGPPSARRKRESIMDHGKSASFASTSNSKSRSGALQKMRNPCSDGVDGKDAISSASSSKEVSRRWKEEEFKAEVDEIRGSRMDGKLEEEDEEEDEEVMLDDLPDVSGLSELKSSITFVAAAQGSMLLKKKKKKRSCWQPLRRKGNRKSRMEKSRKDKRWSSLQGQMFGGGEESAREHGWEAVAPGESCRIFPGDAPSDSWREEEVSAFILALFLFGKDFGRIERFLETKKMIDIVHFYYGEFYRTPAFCRWAGSKNGRSRKYVHGPLVLQGWRQDELLRRLRPYFSDANRDGVEEAVQFFNDRELTVEALMEELKGAVGMGVLVRCIGIGQPKRDLTAVHGDSAKHGGYYPASIGREEDKSCSLLTKEEMLERLCGDVRISKTRTNDLFWEAVWPRLLARGWQSLACEMQLVFLRPGVSKVVRGVSEKGLHFFDSVSDVLKAVANDPRLLDGSELTEDLVEEGSEEQEEEDGQGWSDDMFETLDMHRPRVVAKVAEGKIEGVAASDVKEAVSFKLSSSSEAAHESSESSSVDIDLNRPLPAMFLKSELDEVEEEIEHVEGNRSPGAAMPVVVVQASTTQCRKFSIEDFDLNLPPADDMDCNSPGLAEPDGVDNPSFDGSGGCSTSMSDAFDNNVFTTACSASVPCPDSERLPRRMETFNLNEPLPMSDMAVDEDGFTYVVESSVSPDYHHQGNVAVESAAEEGSRNSVSSAVPCRKEERCATCSAGDEFLLCRCKSRKRCFDEQGSEIDLERQLGNVGRALVPVPKKRVKGWNFPIRLDGIGAPGLRFGIQTEALAHMRKRSAMEEIQFSRGKFSSLNMTILQYQWPWSMPEGIVPIAEPQAPKCRIVEMDDNDAEKASDADLVEGASADTFADVPAHTAVSTLSGAKRLRCFMREDPVYSSNLRSKSRRLPRKFSISFYSESGETNLSKGAEKIPDRSCNREKTLRHGEFPRTCALNSHGSDTIEDGLLVDVKRIVDSSNSENSDDSGFESPHCNNSRRTQAGYGSGNRRITAGATICVSENVAELDSAETLISALKVPSFRTASPPADDASCSPSDDLPLPIPRSRGIRSSSHRSHSYSHSPNIGAGKDRTFLSFPHGKRRSSSTSDIPDLEPPLKRVKDEHPSYSLRNNSSSRDNFITEHEVSATLCSLQEHVVERVPTRRSHAIHKLKGKRSQRLRRRNLTTLTEFIFGDGGCHLDEVEDGLFLQPCTPKGPFQPTGQVPTPNAEKTPRSSKRRRRRSDLPCRASSPAENPLSSTSKSGGGGGSGSTTPKGQGGPSRLPGSQSVGAQGEEPALSKRPLHDVRFSIRRTFSDSAVKPASRQSSRKVPARWNQFSLC